MSCKMSAEEDTKAKNDKEKEKFETLKEMVLLLNQKAATLSTLQRHDEAIDTLKSNIEFCNDWKCSSAYDFNTQHLFVIGLLQSNKRDYDSALKTFNEVVKRNTFSDSLLETVSDSYYLISTIIKKTNRFHEAIDNLKIFLALKCDRASNPPTDEIQKIWDITFKCKKDSVSVAKRNWHIWNMAICIEVYHFQEIWKHWEAGQKKKNDSDLLGAAEAFYLGCEKMKNFLETTEAIDSQDYCMIIKCYTEFVIEFTVFLKSHLSELEHHPMIHTNHTPEKITWNGLVDYFSESTKEATKMLQKTITLQKSMDLFRKVEVFMMYRYNDYYSIQTKNIVKALGFGTLEAIEIAERALKMKKEYYKNSRFSRMDSFEAANMYYLLSKMYWELGEKRKSCSALFKMLDEYEKDENLVEKHKREMFRYYDYIVYVFEKFSSLKMSSEINLLLKNHIEKNFGGANRPKEKRYHGNCLVMTGRYYEGSKVLLEALLAYLMRNEDLVDCADTALDIGEAFMKDAQYLNAIKYLLMFKSFKSCPQKIYEAFAMVGFCHLHLGEFDRAIDYLDKPLPNFLEIARIGRFLAELKRKDSGKALKTIYKRIAKKGINYKSLKFDLKALPIAADFPTYLNAFNVKSVVKNEGKQRRRIHFQKWRKFKNTALIGYHATRIFEDIKIEDHSEEKKVFHLDKFSCMKLDTMNEETRKGIIENIERDLSEL